MESNKVFHTAALIFVFLFGSYLLTFTGIGSTDDEQLYAVLTASLAERGDYNALPLYGNDRVRGSAGGVEPLHPALGIPLYLAAKRFGWGSAQILHLLPGIYTALSAALLAAIAMRRGYSRRTAVILALAFGIGTIAFSYARTNFREPLAMLLLTLAAFWLELALENNRRINSLIIFTCLAFTSAALSVLVKFTTAICLPFFIIAAFLELKKKDLHGIQILGSSLFICATLGFISYYLLNLILPAAGLTRLSSGFIEYLFRTLPRLPHDRFFPALAGILFSPGKGLLVYSPLLFLTLLSLRKIGGTGTKVIAFGSLFGLMTMQALAYNELWWGITWSTRALLPALPLLMLAGLPVLDAGLYNPRKGNRMALCILLGTSALIQFGRVLVSDPVYVGWVMQRYGLVVNAGVQWRLDLMPLLRHWWLFFRGADLDILWANLEGISISLFTLVIYSILMLLAVCGYFLFSKKQANFQFRLFMLLLLVINIPLTLSSAVFDRRYYSGNTDYQLASKYICENTQSGDLVLLDAYLKPLWWRFFNFGCIQAEWVGLPYAHPTANNAALFYPRIGELERLIRAAQARDGEVFLLETGEDSSMPYHEEFKAMGLEMQLMKDDSEDAMPVVIYTIK